MENKFKYVLRKFTVLVKLYNIWINRTRRIYYQSLKELTKKHGIEIGGPSQVFSETGPIPIYSILGSLNNVNFNNETFWSKTDEGNNFCFSKNKPNGEQIIADTVDISIIKNNSYNFLLASHVIEHIANPIKAILEWKRIVKINGILVIIAPDMRNTYDKNRPTTEVNHIIKDYNENTSETDTTHFEEVIRLHDLSMDSTVKNIKEHIKRTNNNFKNRILHHHTFNKQSLIDILKYCNLKIINSQTFKPYHIVVVARKISE